MGDIGYLATDTKRCASIEKISPTEAAALSASLLGAQHRRCSCCNCILLLALTVALPGTRTQATTGRQNHIRLLIRLLLRTKQPINNKTSSTKQHQYWINATKTRKSVYSGCSKNIPDRQLNRRNTHIKTFKIIYLAATESVSR